MRQWARSRDPGWYYDGPYAGQAYWDGEKWTGTIRSTQEVEASVWLVMARNLATAALFVIVALAILSVLH